MQPVPHFSTATLRTFRPPFPALENFIKTYNENAKPFVWTKKVDEILEKVNRCKAIMDTLH
jgi:hypothetical protein